MIGGLTGAAAGFIGSAEFFKGGFNIGGATSRQVIAHGVVGGAASEAQGGKFGQGFITSAFGKAVSKPLANLTDRNAIAGGIAAGVVGGTVSKLTGGKFQNGAITSAFQYLFNQAASNVEANAEEGGYSPVSGEYLTSDGKIVSLTVQSAEGGFTYLADEEFNLYSFDSTTGLVDSGLFHGRSESVCPSCYAVGAGIASRSVYLGARALGPSGSIIGNPAYGGRSYRFFSQGKRRFNWGRDDGPVLRVGIGNRHFDILRTKTPKQ